MNKEEILKHVDHTQLKAYCTWSDIKKICDEAIKYKTASVCIPPSFISRVKEEYKGLNICTVIGFPLGYNTTEVKRLETLDAIKNGANEIDMVINISDAKEHNYSKIEEEIKAIKEACGSHILKVIIETCYLDDDEKINLCKCINNAGADYIKTSTGFGTSGAKKEDIVLFKKYINPNVKIKAAGGIKTKEDILSFLDLGADRLGSSSAIDILNKDE